MLRVAEVLARVGIKGIEERKAKLIVGIGLCGIALIGLTSVWPRADKAVARPVGGQVGAASPSGVAAAPETAGASGELDELSRYSRELECRAQETLSRVGGVGRVWVTISMEQGTATDYATNQTTERRTVTEKDAGGGTKSTTESTTTAQVVAMRGASEGERPVLVKRTVPQIAGVLVVAQGAMDAGSKLELTQATSTLLGVPEHRILVAGTEKGR